jgi:DNA processing protein
MIDQTPYVVAFSHMLGIGPLTYQKLIAHFQTPQKTYTAKTTEIANIIGPATAKKFDDFRSTFKTDSMMEKLSTKNIQVLSFGASNYPKLLAQISDPPICLYLVGNKNIFAQNEDRYIAIVGTRRVTTYGAQVAAQFAEGLSRAGFVIVSGMALGIDSIAHEQTLRSGGTTVAVLGCGVDIVYPPSNRTLYESITKSGGAIVSEFPPGHTVLPGFFVTRNRIVAGMSRGVLVVEGAGKSGTLITARYAAEQGRDVFAPPSPITSAYSEAPNRLIKDGATMVISPEDIIKEYGVVTTHVVKDILSSVEGQTRRIIELLLQEPHLADDLQQKMKISVDTIMQELTLLEIEGLVAKNSEGKYYIK